MRPEITNKEHRAVYAVIDILADLTQEMKARLQVEPKVAIVAMKAFLWAAEQEGPVDAEVARKKIAEIWQETPEHFGGKAFRA